MPDIEITVRGTAAATHPPELATVHLAAAAQGSDRAHVQHQVGAAARAITDSILPLSGDDGPVTRWSSDQLRVDTHREHKGSKADRAVLVHSAEIEFRVRFRGGDESGPEGFAALDTWLGSIAAVDDVEVRNVRWMLTDERRDQVSEQVRSAAVGDGQERAAAYARDLGLTTVRLLAVADPGLLGRSAEHGGWTNQSASRAVALGAAMQLRFRPEEIEVRAAVDMRFAAADGAD